MEHHLQIQGVTKYYKNFKAVDDISLNVDEGRFLTILGPSGSGKTTLLKMIAGFEGLSNGSIQMDGIEIGSKKPNERNIGMVFQNYALFPHMNVAENIEYPLRRRKVKKNEIQQKVQDILKVVHLEQFDKKYPSQLSGGQQQRVALARAVVFNPPLLLLDEPLGALDKKLRQEMQYEVASIQKELGITTVSVTHDQEEALTMSDEICVMNNGSIEQIDTPENLYRFPQSRFVAEFIGDINLIKGNIVAYDSETAKIKLSHKKAITVKRTSANEEMKEGAILVAIRPERIQLVNGTKEFTNTLQAEIFDLIYVGDAVKAKVKTSIDVELTIKVPAFQTSSLAIGKKIELGWNIEDATFLPDEEAEAVENIEEPKQKQS